MHFLGRKDSAESLLRPPRPIPDDARAAGGARVAAARREVWPGFVCNLYYDTGAKADDEALMWLDSSKIGDHSVRAQVGGASARAAARSFGCV